MLPWPLLQGRCVDGAPTPRIPSCADGLNGLVLDEREYKADRTSRDRPPLAQANSERNRSQTRREGSRHELTRPAQTRREGSRHELTRPAASYKATSTPSALAPPLPAAGPRP